MQHSCTRTCTSHYSLHMAGKKGRALSARPCKGTNRDNRPCRAPALKGQEWCRAHSPYVPESARFGTPAQARAAVAQRPSARYPRLHEIVEREIERRAEEIVGAALAALQAETLIVDKDGGEHRQEDGRTRLAAAVALMDRGLGRPATSGTLDVETRALVVELDARNPDARAALASVLRSRPVGRGGPGEV